MNIQGKDFCMRMLAISIPILFVLGCEPHKFAAGDGAKKDAKTSEDPKISTPSESKDEKKDEEKIDGNDPEENTDVLGCPETKQNILIVDLKSGWWAGDGASFFHSILSGLSLNCKTSIKIEYHHITLFGMQTHVYPDDSNSTVPDDFFDEFGVDGDDIDFAAEFRESDWANYNQVWLLSGALHDPADISVSSPTFQGILSRVKPLKASLFIGSGAGSILHSNALTSALGLGDRFGTTQSQNNILGFEPAGLKVANWSTPVAPHALWTGVTKIADEIETFGELARGDYISNTSSLTVLAMNQENKAGIAVGTASGERRMVLDAGLQRYYAIALPEEKETLTFLQNTIRFLAQP